MTLTPTDSGVGRPFFGRVEAVRGLGALAVAGFHFTGCTINGIPLLQPAHWPAASPDQIAVGRLGLALFPGHAFLSAFFVISGLVLRVALVHGPQATGPATAKFVLARLFRFYPIVAVAVLLAALWPPHGAIGPSPGPDRLVANLLLLDVSLNPHLWALQVELLLAPVVLALYFLERRFGPAVPVAVAVPTTALAFAPSWAGSPGLSTYLFAVVIGTTLPTAGRWLVAGMSRPVAVAYAAAAAGVLLTVGQFLGVFARASTVIEVYAAAAVLSVVAYRPDVTALSVLDAAWLRRLGAVSGSYYVLHMATVPPAWTTAAPGPVGVLVIAVWLAAIAPLMVLASRLVETPGVAAGRWLTRRLGLDGRRPARPVLSVLSSESAVLPAPLPEQQPVRRAA